MTETGGFKLKFIVFIRHFLYLLGFLRKSGILISTGFTVLSGCFGFWIPEYVEGVGDGAAGLVVVVLVKFPGVAVRFNKPVAGIPARVVGAAVWFG